MAIFSFKKCLNHFDHYKSTFNMDMVANEFWSSPFFKIIILNLNHIYIGHICKLLC